MKNLKKVGVWMDYSNAYILEAEKKAVDIKTINSGYIRQYREKGEVSDTTIFSSSAGKGFHMSNNEFKKNNIKQNELKSYFTDLQKELENYDEIVLLGPSTAKEEFNNLMEANKHFKTKIIKLETLDRVTPNQLAAKINELFS